MVIMSFGSGFEHGRRNPQYLPDQRARPITPTAKGIELGGYSLLASRSIDPENDVINPTTGKPGGGSFGNSPCLGSQWGEAYFRKLDQFVEDTGFDVARTRRLLPRRRLRLHQPPRPLAASTIPSGTSGRPSPTSTSGAVRRGVYLNVPDLVFPHRLQQSRAWAIAKPTGPCPAISRIIHARQNIFDGTWEKTPSMGWMFVPLTQYHGGGAAATIEPPPRSSRRLRAHLANLFGAGVQACYRGPRLYDTEETKPIVKKWVDFYKSTSRHPRLRHHPRPPRRRPATSTASCT